VLKILVGMTTKPTYVSFYTINTPYEAESKKLVETLDKHKLIHKEYAVVSTGSWERNTQLKSAVLCKALEEITGPVVYLDSDARVLSYPTLFDRFPECDIAFHYFRGVELLSGTLYLPNTETCKDLVALWDSRNKTEPGTWDQKTLQKIIEAGSYDWLNIPEEYVWISGLATVPNPVILHTQASRVNRKKIHAGT